MFQPKTGQYCHCKKGVQRDNCPDCEGTGMQIDFAAIRKLAAAKMLGLPPRVIPVTALRPKVKQNEAPLELERPGIDAKEPKLF